MWRPSKLPMATTVPPGKAGRSWSPRRTCIGSDDDGLGFFQVAHPELLEAGIQESFLLRLQVSLGPVFEEVEDIDKPPGQAQVHFRPRLVRFAHEAGLEQSLGIKGQNEGAEIEGGQEFLSGSLGRRFRPFRSARVVCGHYHPRVEL